MKRRFLVLFSTIFALAAITLVLVQIWQTRKAAEMSDNLVNICVNNAIDEVFNQIDQMRVEDYLNAEERYKLVRNRRIDEFNEKMQDIIRTNSNLFYDESRVVFGISTVDSAMEKNGATISNEEHDAIAEYNILLKARNRLIDNTKHSGNNGTLSIDPTKINYELLDSLVREELIVNGVETPPYVGVLQVASDSLLYCSAESDSAKLKLTPFKYAFQVSGIQNTDEIFVVLYFPPTPLILSAGANWSTIFSICMILLITFLFIFSIRTIWSQRKLDEMKTDFINNMTHEIKTPIATIGLACEMLRDPSVSTDVASLRNFVDIIGNENRRMRVLIETLLQSAKMASKKFSIAPKEIDLNSVVNNAIESFVLSVKNRNGILETDLQPITGTLFADELHVSNMIHNLIDNAIKYSASDLFIRITTSMEDGFAVLRIQDHGIGIAKEDQKHIFEKFYRVSTGNVHNVKGFGIGLNYVAQVVALHKGKISVESEPNQGSTFTIQLPLD